MLATQNAGSNRRAIHESAALRSRILLPVLPLVLPLLATAIATLLPHYRHTTCARLQLVSR